MANNNVANSNKEIAMKHLRWTLSDNQLKTLIAKMNASVGFAGIVDSKGNTYYHVKLTVAGKQIADEQFADCIDGKFNTSGSTIGKRYISYAVAEVRKNLKFALFRTYAIQQGLINPEEELFDGFIDDYSATADAPADAPATDGNANAEGAVF